jgi:hypothetical protein
MRYTSTKSLQWYNNFILTFKKKSQHLNLKLFILI